MPTGKNYKAEAFKEFAQEEFALASALHSLKQSKHWQSALAATIDATVTLMLSRERLPEDLRHIPLESYEAALSRVIQHCQHKAESNEDFTLGPSLVDLLRYSIQTT